MSLSAVPGAVATLIDSAGALLLEDWIRMDRLLPHPRTPVGYRRDGRPIFPILGADPTAPSNQQLPPAPSSEPAMPPAQMPDQDALNRLLAREKQQGERSAVRRLVEQLGFTKTDDLTAFVQQQRDAQAAQLSEIERREQAAAEATTAAAAREAQAVARERAAVRRAALVALGATGEDLKDAERLLAVDDADEDAITEAAQALKARRPELFAATAAPVPPAAPGGSPAGGPPPRGASVAKPGQYGANIARQRGFLKDN